MNQRIRSAVVLSLLAGCASVTACSSRSTPAAIDDQLAKDTGTRWIVYRDPRSAEVRFLAPSAPVRVGTGTPEAMARDFLTRYADPLHGASDQLSLTTTSTDPHGDVHLRFEHRVPGTDLRVFDSGTTAHFTSDGRLTWLITDFHDGLASIDRTASITADAATATGLAHLHASCGAVTRGPVVGTNELGVLANEDIHPTLAYRLTFDLDSSGCLAPTVYVDAKTGAPLLLQERAHSIDAPVRGSRGQVLGEFDNKVINVSRVAPDSTQFQMVTETASPLDLKVRTHAGNYPTDVVLTSPNAVDWDLAATPNAAANDAHYYTMRALAFLRPFAGTIGVSPLTRDANVWVHYNEGPSKGFNGYGVYDEKRDMDTLRFGDGNPADNPTALPIPSGLDAVAHEVTHLITAHTSKLTYARESGALNESFSDVMGASAEHADDPDDAKNFLIGERIFRPAGPAFPRCLRDMENPHSQLQPDRYEEMKRRCGPDDTPDAEKNDFCDVHANSGIPNRAFSLMVKGGGIVREADTLGVPVGIGWETSTSIWYWGVTHLNASATFALAAFAEYAVSSAYHAEATVACAWIAVGVVSRNDLPWSLYADQCTAPAAPAPSPPAPAPDPTKTDLCAGHGNNPVCDPTVPYLAAVCVAGMQAGSVTCGDKTTSCTPVSATDPTASIDPIEGLACQ